MGTKMTKTKKQQAPINPEFAEIRKLIGASSLEVLQARLEIVFADVERCRAEYGREGEPTDDAQAMGLMIALRLLASGEDRPLVPPSASPEELRSTTCDGTVVVPGTIVYWRNDDVLVCGVVREVERDGTLVVGILGRHARLKSVDVMTWTGHGSQGARPESCCTLLVAGRVPGSLCRLRHV